MDTVTGWVDGKPVSEIPTTDRGLAYGDGVFETVRVVAGEMTLAHYHWARLAASCERLGIAVNITDMQQAVRRFLTGRDTGILKVMVTRGSGGLGYNPKACGSRLIFLWRHLPAYPASHWVTGIELYPCSLPLGLQPALAGIKHLNRLEQVLARAEWDDSRYAEGLLTNLNGHLIEGTMSNLFLVKSGVLCTPDLRLSGVAGVMRQWILDTMPERGIMTQVRDISLQDMRQATEVFVSNSVNGVWPVVAYAGMQWGTGSVTRQVQSAVTGILHV